MKVFWVYGEDTPHRDQPPYKSYMVVAPDEAGARALAPEHFRVDGIAFIKDYPDAQGAPARWGWVGSAYPQERGQD